MVNRTIQIRRKNKETNIWENLDPITKSSNVIHESGENTQEKMTLVEQDVQQINTTLSGFSDDINYISTQQIGGEIREENHINNRLRFATFNYKYGSNHFENAPLLEAQKIMEKSGADIIGMQEIGTTYYFDTKKYTTNFFPYHHFIESIIPISLPPRSYGNLTVSSLAFTQVGGELFTNPPAGIEQRSYNRTEFTHKGHTYAFYTIHLPHESVEARNEVIDELFLIVQADTVANKIIVGDLNTRWISDFDAFTNAGYIFHNDNEYATFKPSGESIDNVITSSNLIAFNKGIIETGDTSDHNLFYVDVTMLTE